MNEDPHLRLIISHGFNDIHIKSIMTVLDNKPLTNAYINKKWGHRINEKLNRS